MARLKIGYLSITPESTGQPIAGPSVYSQAQDTIEVLDMQHRISHEYDTQHGTPSGDRAHSPLMVIKEVDVTSPLLCIMCANAELLTEVKLQYFVQVGNAPDPVPFFTWTLTNAYITHVRCIPMTEMHPDYSEEYDLLEEVAFAYQQVQWEHHAHRHPIGLKDLAQEIQADAWSAIG